MGFDTGHDSKEGLDMTRRELTLVAAILGGLAAPAAAEVPEHPMRLAQSVNETLPGGVENRPGGTDKAFGSTRGIRSAPRAITAPPAPQPSAGSSAAGAADFDAAKPNTDGKRSTKKAAPAKSAPYAVERAPEAERAPAGAARGDGLPRPIRPDESIPGGAERAPGNAQ